MGPLSETDRIKLNGNQQIQQKKEISGIKEDCLLARTRWSRCLTWRSPRSWAPRWCFPWRNCKRCSRLPCSQSSKWTIPRCWCCLSAVSPKRSSILYRDSSNLDGAISWGTSVSACNPSVLFLSICCTGSYWCRSRSYLQTDTGFPGSAVIVNKKS